MHRDLHSHKMQTFIFGMNEGFQKREFSRKTLQHLFVSGLSTYSCETWNDWNPRLENAPLTCWPETTLTSLFQMHSNAVKCFGVYRLAACCKWMQASLKQVSFPRAPLGAHVMNCLRILEI